MTHIIGMLWWSITEDRNIIICLTNPSFVRHLFSIFHYNQSHNNYSCSYLHIHGYLLRKKFNMGQCKSILFFKLLSIRKMAIYPPTNNTEGICLPRAVQSQCDRGCLLHEYGSALLHLPLCLQFGWIGRLVLARGNMRRSKGIISRTRLLRTGVIPSSQLLERMKGKNSKLWSGEIKSNPAPGSPLEIRLNREEYGYLRPLRFLSLLLQFSIN